MGRLTDADYSTGESFKYEYDAVGNRDVFTSTTPLSGTLVTTYTFDAANRLTARSVSDGRSYSYAWSQRGQLLAEDTQGVDVRTFTYDGAGRLVEATVFTLITRFTYNGLGARTSVEVVGHDTTTITLDYAANNRILAETTITGTVRYLYGLDCLGELRDDEWLYYQHDGEELVRQGTDAEGEVVSMWLFDPDGTLLEGPEGPVSHLMCGGVYDWSTGLVYKDGQYFDPMLGIWLALMPLMVVQSWRKRKERRGGLWAVMLVLFLVGVSGMLTGCEESCSLPQQYCIDEVEATPLGPPLNDRACFVGPVSGKTIPTHTDALTWSDSDKQVSEAALNVAIRDKYGGSTGFVGGLDEALREFGMSSDNPLLIFRKPKNGAISASILIPDLYLDILGKFFDDDSTLQAANLCHEMAHRWDYVQGGGLDASAEMQDWTNWGIEATHYASTDPSREDISEAVRLYFYPQYNVGEEDLGTGLRIGRRWTDDEMIADDGTIIQGVKPDGTREGSVFKAYNWLTASDQLMLDASGVPSKNGTIRVKDRYDWLQMKFGRSW